MRAFACSAAGALLARCVLMSYRVSRVCVRANRKRGALDLVPRTRVAAAAAVAVAAAAAAAHGAGFTEGS